MPRQETPESLVRKIRKTPGFTVENKSSGLGYMACNEARRQEEKANPDQAVGGWRTGIGLHFSDRRSFDNCLQRLRRIGWSHTVYEEGLHAEHERRLDKARAEDKTVADNLFGNWNPPEPEPEPVVAEPSAAQVVGQLGGGENVYDLSTFTATRTCAPRASGPRPDLGQAGWQNYEAPLQGPPEDAGNVP